MRQIDSNASPLRVVARRLRAAVVLSGFLVAGCFISPLGTNTAPDVLPTPDATSGKVKVTYVPSGQEPAKVTFVVEPPEGEALKVEDDSPDDGFTAEFDVKAFPAGVYPVSVTLDDAEAPAAKLAFVKPAAAGSEEKAADKEKAPATGETGGEGEATAGEGEAAAGDGEATGEGEAAAGDAAAE